MNSINPNDLWKAVYCLQLSFKGICQYPLVRSSLVKYLALVILVTISSICGIGSLSNMVIELNFLKSIHRRMFPSGFDTSVIGLQYGLLEGLIISCSSIVSISFSIASLALKGVGYWCTFKGFVSVSLISCCKTSVLPGT